MKKFLIPLLTLSLLTGCATFNNDVAKVKTAVAEVFTPDNFDTVTGAYGAAEAIALSYGRSCQQKVINKSCWNVIAILKPYEQKAYDAYISLKGFVRSNPTADASSFIVALRTAVTNFNSAQSKYGVK